MEEKILVVGPSHVVRWDYFLGGIVPEFKEKNVELKGYAGAPIWDDSVLGDVYSDKYDHVYIILGDFRLGNNVCSNCPEKYGSLLGKGIEKEFINPDIDRLLYEKSISVLREIIANLGSKCTIIPWSLFLREYRNLQAGKYLNDNLEYSHPIWNLRELESLFPYNCMKLSGVLNSQKPFQLYVDSSGHPSLKGFLFLRGLVENSEFFSDNKKLIEFFDGLTKSEVFEFSLSEKTLVVGLDGKKDDSSEFVKKIISYQKKNLLKISNFQVVKNRKDFERKKHLLNSASKLVVVSDLAPEDVPSDKMSYANEVVQALNIPSSIKEVKFFFWRYSFSEHGSDCFLSLLSTEETNDSPLSGLDINFIIEKNKAFHPTLFSIRRMFSYVDKNEYTMTEYDKDIKGFLDSSKLLSDDNISHRSEEDVKKYQAARKKAKIAISKNEWLDGVEALSSLNFIDPNEKLITKIIYDKNHRPDKISDQAALLKKIHGIAGLSLCHRLNAATAYSHKAMESMSNNDVLDAINLINNNLSLVDSVGESDYLREDSIHIRYSMLCVLWHLYFFIGDYNSFLSVGDDSSLGISELTEFNVGPAFYQTCTNIVRILAIAYLKALVVKDSAKADDALKNIERILWLGLVKSDNHKIKFKEYLGMTALWHDLKRYKTGLERVFDNIAPDKKGVEVVLKRAMRSHGVDKMLHMDKRIEEFYIEQWG